MKITPYHPRTSANCSTLRHAKPRLNILCRMYYWCAFTLCAYNTHLQNHKKSLFKQNLQYGISHVQLSSEIFVKRKKGYLVLPVQLSSKIIFINKDYLVSHVELSSKIIFKRKKII